METARDLIIKSIQARGPLSDPTASLRKMLEVCDTQVFLKACMERIFDEQLYDNKDIIIDVEDPYNLILTARGIVKTKDILESYIPRENLDELLNYLIKYNMLIRNASDIASFLSKVKKTDLKTMAKGCFHDTTVANYEEDIKIYAAEELKQRRLSSIVKRKISKIAASAELFWKYRRVILFAAFHPTVMSE